MTLSEAANIGRPSALFTNTEMADAPSAVLS